MPSLVLLINRVNATKSSTVEITITIYHRHIKSQHLNGLVLRDGGILAGLEPMTRKNRVLKHDGRADGADQHGELWAVLGPQWPDGDPLIEGPQGARCQNGQDEGQGMGMWQRTVKM